MKVHQVPVGLDGDDDAGDVGFVLARRPEEGLEGVDGAQAQLPQKAAILPEVRPEHLRHGEDVLAMRDGGQDVSGHPASELQHPLLGSATGELSRWLLARWLSP